MTGTVGMRAGATLAVVAVVALLAGCAPTPPPPGLGEEELQEYRAARVDWYADALGEKDMTLATLGFVRFVDPYDLDDHLVVQDCMEKVAVDFEGRTTNVGYVAFVSCDMSYPPRPELAGTFAEGQLDYVYDYYQDNLLPCMRTLGVIGDAPPSREDWKAAARLGRAWTPYWGDFSALSPAQSLRVQLSCPESPFGGNDRIMW